MKRNFVSLKFNRDPERGICINLDNVMCIQPSSKNIHDTAIILTNGSVITINMEYVDFIKKLKVNKVIE